MSGPAPFAFPLLILCLVCVFVWLTVREDRPPSDGAEFMPSKAAQRWPYATLAIIALNLLVYVRAGLDGAGWLKVNVPTLLEMGGNLAPATATGEWQRLVFAMFLHGGLMHVAFNMLALWDAGRVMERLLGRWRYVALYLSAGVAGNLLSINWQQEAVAVGASGAVFGVYGGLISALFLQKGLLPPEVALRLRAGAMAFVIYALGSGFLSEQVDNAAHVGGLLAGAVLGVALFAPPWRAWALAGCLAGLLAFGMARAAALVEPIRDEMRFRQFMAGFNPEEKRLNDLHNQLLAAGKAGLLAIPEFANRLDSEVIPGWREQERRIEDLRYLTEHNRKLRDPLSKVIHLRREALELLRDAMRRQDAALLRRYAAKVEETNAAVKELEAVHGTAKNGSGS